MNAAPSAYKVSWIHRETDFEVHLKQLYINRQFADVLLYCEGQVLRAHKFVLDFGSTQFKCMLKNAGTFWQEKEQMVFYMHNVHLQTLQSVLQFMYTGEVSVPSDRFEDFMRLCKSLGVKGLSNVISSEHETTLLPPTWSSEPDESPDTPPPAFIPIVEMAEENAGHIEEQNGDQTLSDTTTPSTNSMPSAIVNENLIIGDIGKTPADGEPIPMAVDVPDAMVNFVPIEEQSQASSLSGISISSAVDTSSGFPVKTEFSEDSMTFEVLQVDQDPFKDVTDAADESDKIPLSKRSRDQIEGIRKSLRSTRSLRSDSTVPTATALKAAILRRSSHKSPRSSPKPGTSTKLKTPPKTPEANRIDINNPIALFCLDCNARVKVRPEIHTTKHHNGEPGNYRHECTLCQETFKQHFTAISHFRFVHNQQRTKYKCSNCGAEFVEVTTAARHKQHCHPPVKM